MGLRRRGRERAVRNLAAIGERGERGESEESSNCWKLFFTWIGEQVPELCKRENVGEDFEEEEEQSSESKGAKMVAASKEMAVYCFDTLVSHYTGDVAPPPGFEEGQL